MTPTVLLSTGDIFESGCEALVSPVDCSGAQGAGLALAFAKRFPRQTAWYREHGRHGFAEPGHVYHMLPRADEDRTVAARWILEEHRRDGSEPLVLFATTKFHHSKPSRLSYVTDCIAALVDAVTELGIRSLAVPALGLGLGQRGIKPADAFSWNNVRPLILAAAERMPCERVAVFAPR